MDRRLVSILAVACGAAACQIKEPFARDNLWDSGGTAVVDLAGPDSTFSQGDEFEMSVITDPLPPPGPISVEWTTIDIRTYADTKLSALGSGQYRVVAASAQYREIPVFARLYNRTIAFPVLVGQKAGLFDVFCGTQFAEVACDDTPLAVNAILRVNGTVMDARGNEINARSVLMARTVVTSRNPAVAVPVQRTADANVYWDLRAVAPGATWLVISADGLRDSVRVVVAP